jgi:hydroxysqualene dehydroxylase
MPDFIVIGGGFAGLSAAVHLSNSGKSVELIEASQKLGGRAYSFLDNNTNTIIDNGQHIMMGCYKETLNFFKIIEAADNLFLQEKLKVNFLKPYFEITPLQAVSKFYPVNLLLGLLNYKAISIKERILLLRFFLILPLYSDKDLSRLTIYDWLIMENQSDKIIKSFWEIIAVGALNTDTKKASAKVFKHILLEIFFKGNKAASIVLPKIGLTEAYCIDAKNFIESRGGEISIGEQVNKAFIDGNRLKSIVTNKREIVNFKYIISSVPHYALRRILPDENIVVDPGFEYSSILNIHIWLKENKLEKTFYGLIDSDIHWIFNHGTHLTLVRSNANELMERSKEEIFEVVKLELYKYCFIEEDNIIAYRIIKEKRSTFIPSNDILYNRPGTETSITNLLLAGDWVNTGLPSTIESAVKSGRMAAELIS